MPPAPLGFAMTSKVPRWQGPSFNRPLDAASYSWGVVQRRSAIDTWTEIFLHLIGRHVNEILSRIELNSGENAGSENFWELLMID